MNLRWIERDGEKVLQEANCFMGVDHVVRGDHLDKCWTDVPIVKEPRKAREWWVKANDNQTWMIYENKFDNHKWIRVREVLPGDDGKGE